MLGIGGALPQHLRGLEGGTTQGRGEQVECTCLGAESLDESGGRGGASQRSCTLLTLLFNAVNGLQPKSDGLHPELPEHL